jgi:hypothetical protein
MNHGARNICPMPTLELFLRPIVQSITLVFLPLPPAATANLVIADEGKTVG